MQLNGVLHFCATNLQKNMANYIEIDGRRVDFSENNMIYYLTSFSILT